MAKPQFPTGRLNCADGSEQQESPLFPRGHQLHLPQLGDRALPPPDLPQRVDGPDGLVADPGAGYVPRCDISPLSKSLYI